MNRARSHARRRTASTVWRGMNDEQRAAARERYQEFRRLPPNERARLIDVYRRYRTLPPDRRMELRQRFRELSPEQRQTLRERRLTPAAAESPGGARWR